MTITLSPRADQYVRSKVVRRADLGRFISDTLVEAETREQVREEMQRQQPSSKESWEASGINVD